MLRHASALLFAFAIATAIARAGDATATPSPSPAPAASGANTDVTADESLISPIHTYSIQATYTGSSYGPRNVRASQIIQRVAVFYVGKYLMRVTLPRLQTVNNVDSGYGDLQMFYLLNTNVERGRSYVGIFGQIPTGTPATFSQRKWLLGPALAHIFDYKPRGRVIGVLLQMAFSVAGPKDAPNQSAISLLPFASVRLNHGWFLKTPESPWLFDLVRGQTLIALGLGIGRQVTIFGVPSLVAISDEGTVIHANVVNVPKNTMRFTATFILTSR